MMIMLILKKKVKRMFQFIQSMNLPVVKPADIEKENRIKRFVTVEENPSVVGVNL